MNLQEFIEKHGNVTVNEKELKELLGIDDKKYFIPKLGEEYWYVDFDGDVDYTINVFDTIDTEIFENNEVFSTKKEAEQHAKKKRFLLQMKRDFLDNSDEIDWKDDNQEKFILLYEHRVNNVEICNWWGLQSSNMVTTNKEWLEEYIEKHESEIKKYYFGIDEE